MPPVRSGSCPGAGRHRRRSSARNGTKLDQPHQHAAGPRLPAPTPRSRSRDDARGPRRSARPRRRRSRASPPGARPARPTTTPTPGSSARRPRIGKAPSMTVAVWVGYPNGDKSMAKDYGGKPVYGGTYPALIWQAYVEAALRYYNTGSTGITSSTRALDADATPRRRSSTGATTSSRPRRPRRSPPAASGTARRRPARRLAASGATTADRRGRRARSPAAAATHADHARDDHARDDDPGDTPAQHEHRRRRRRARQRRRTLRALSAARRSGSRAR